MISNTAEMQEMAQYATESRSKNCQRKPCRELISESGREVAAQRCVMDCRTREANVGNSMEGAMPIILESGALIG